MADATPVTSDPEAPVEPVVEETTPQKGRRKAAEEPAEDPRGVRLTSHEAYRLG